MYIIELTKDDAKAMHGLAAILMITHHLFAFPDRTPPYISILLIKEIPIEFFVGQLCKLCVGIYAFLSGYGLYEKHSNSFIGNLKVCGKSLFKFYSNYWCVLFLFTPIGIYFHYIKLSFVELFLSILGYFHYNQEWWYINVYLFMLLTFPFKCLLLKQATTSFKSVLIELPWVLMTWLLIKCTHEGYIYLLFFDAGLYMSKYKYFKNINKYIFLKQLLNCIFFICLIIRLVKYNYLIDFILSPLLIFFLTPYIRKNYIGKFLMYIGKYSVFIWLIHTFFIYYYWQNIYFKFRYSILIFLSVMLISLLISKILYIFSNKFRLIIQLFFSHLMKNA